MLHTAVALRLPPSPPRFRGLAIHSPMPQQGSRTDVLNRSARTPMQEARACGQAECAALLEERGQLLSPARAARRATPAAAAPRRPSD